MSTRARWRRYSALAFVSLGGLVPSAARSAAAAASCAATCERLLDGRRAQRRRAHVRQRDAASSTLPLSRRSTAATPTVAQSWARRLNFRYDQPLDARASARGSPSARPAARAPSRRRPRKKSAAGNRPLAARARARRARRRARAARSAGRRPGSPCATEPPIVPRWRTCGSPIEPRRVRDDRAVLLHAAGRSRGRGGA